MQKTSLTILLLFITTILLGQKKIEEYVRNNTYPVKNIEPDSAEFTDLNVIGDAIGDSKIVFLGEQDHGDAPAFLAKTRLIKYLHEKKGFNVLAFESDFFALTYGWDCLPKNKEAIDSFIIRNIFPVWTYCNACSQLFYKYIPESYQTSSPLIVTGFDDQLILTYSSRNLGAKLDSVLTRLKVPLTLQPNYTTEVLPLLNSLHGQFTTVTDSSIFARRDLYLTEIRRQLGEKLSPADYWMIVIDNLIQENYQFKNLKNDYWIHSNARDKQMAHNLKWIAENKYPGMKIIVWAHNYHVSKYNSHYPEDFLNKAKTMGGVFTSDSAWDAKTYIIGFTSYEGSAGRIYQKKYDLSKPGTNSFERWINPRYSYAFTNFKPYNSSHPEADEYFDMAGSIKGSGMHTHHKAAWNKIFDGVFFIKTMYPCERRN